MQRHRDRLQHRRLGKRQRIGQPVHDRSGRDVLRERASAPVLAAGNADHLPVVAQVDFAAQAEVALAAVHRRVERDAIADRNRLHRRAHRSDNPAASCPITMGGMRRPEVPSYPCTSLPQMPHAATWINTSVGPQRGRATSPHTRFAIAST